MRILKEFLKLKWSDIKDSIPYIVPMPCALIIVGDCVWIVNKVNVNVYKGDLWLLFSKYSTICMWLTLIGFIAIIGYLNFVDWKTAKRIKGE